MKTSTIIEYGAVDLTAKADSQISVNNSQDFVDIEDLKKNKLKETKYSTLEKNHFVLDGKSVNMGDSVTEAGWWSRWMSDSNGTFSSPLVMTINFTQGHSSMGLTLTFSEYAYCNNLKIQYYNASNTLIYENTFHPDSYEYFCEGTATNYRKIVITFYSTNIPYRYLKLYSIMYGQVILFQGENLISANILEQIDVLSNELSINTLDFVAYDEKLNIFNPQVVSGAIQERQKLNVYQVKNDEIINFGTYYIQKWQNQNNSKMEFSAIDLIGLLDGGTFYGGMYTDITFENLISQIFESAGISSTLYHIQDELKNLTLTGYMPVMTPREALQQVLFLTGAVANCARTDIIEIYLIEGTEPNQISRSNIFKGSEKIERDSLITGVSIKSHNYAKAFYEITLFEGSLVAGRHTIIFDQPAWDVTCSEDATVIELGTNYIIVELTRTRTITVTGWPYKDSMQDVLISNPSASGYEVSNLLKIESMYLINNSNAQSVGQRIMNFYEDKYTSKFKFVLDDEKVGENVILEENLGNSLEGYISSLDIDLTGGYVADAEIVAKVGENS